MAVIFDKYIPDYLNPGIPRIGESESRRAIFSAPV